MFSYIIFRKHLLDELAATIWFSLGLVGYYFKWSWTFRVISRKNDSLEKFLTGHLFDFEAAKELIFAELIVFFSEDGKVEKVALENWDDINV